MSKYKCCKLHGENEEPASIVSWPHLQCDSQFVILLLTRESSLYAKFALYYSVVKESGA